MQEKNIKLVLWWRESYLPPQHDQVETLIEWANNLPTDGSVPCGALKALLAYVAQVPNV